MTSAILSVSVLLIVFCTADGFLSFGVDRCQFNSTNPEDIEYIYSEYFNKKELLRFSSSVGKFVGFDKYGKYQAEYFNNNTAYLEQMRNEKARYCGRNVPNDNNCILSKSVEPYVVLSSVPPAPGHHATLACSVFKFFPKEITVEWQINGKTVTTGVSTTDVLPSGDWYNQVHSNLEYTPGSGEVSCVVHHRSLMKPLATVWESSMPESEKSKIAIGASGLILGLILTLAGFIYYKTKSRGRILVPSS
ncbi:H-2 class II histocompatibility antigen, E-S beta chain-like [Nelusetta ayraudi]|uniref:H-2 class II histocompatibility antigen, E-S beta chain-like n=1 Tax=Nelusetta ayraudi TaxID=303726 RepID=UPI003F6F50BB